MAGTATHPWLELRHEADVAVVTFTYPELMHEEEVDLLGRHLRGLVEHHGCRRLVLDFQEVDLMGSDMLSELILLHKAVQAAGGRLALCGLHSHLRRVFASLRFDSIFTVCYDEEEAVRACTAGGRDPGAPVP
jgi:anti-anti-sigma factor